MATKVFMEALSPTMEEGVLTQWTKNEGDAVKSGDVIAEIETDKAIMELVARGDGILRKQLIAGGATAPVGTLIGVIAAADENIDSLVGGAGASAPKPEASAPPAGSDATPAAPPASGASTESAVPKSEDPAHATETGSKGATAITAGSAGAPQAGAKEETGAATSHDPNAPRPKSSPLARRLASDQGIELSSIDGSGPGGRIIKRDIEAALASGGTAKPAASTSAPARAAASGADYVDIPLTQIRKTIARRLSESIGPIPTFYLTAEYDISKVTELRTAMTELGDEFKVSVNDIIIKAVATALAKHPEVNAHWTGDGIRQFNRVHIGMAVAIDDGLITPVIFDADRKGLSEISAEAKVLAKKARERKLKPEEFTGSTFSISNLGMFGIDQFTAIINPPEVGILAVGSATDTPVVVNGELTIQKRLRVTMSCDHRAVDGATGAKFLQTLRRLLENPLMLIY